MNKVESVDFDVIIFDYDGTLAESPDTFTLEALGEMVETGYLNSNQIINWKEKSLCNELIKLGINMEDPFMAARVARKLHRHYDGKIKLFNWTKEVIPQLAERKRLAILSNNCRKSVIENLGELLQCFSIIETMESVPKLKPAPDGIIQICRELKVREDKVIMVGDGAEDVEAAIAAGIKIALADWSEYKNNSYAFISSAELEMNSLGFFKNPNDLFELIAA